MFTKYRFNVWTYRKHQQDWSNKRPDEAALEREPAAEEESRGQKIHYITKFH